MPSRHRLSPLVLAGVLVAVAIALTHAGEIRGRAGEALGRGVPDREAALARGFVLGEDDEVDATTTEDFRRAGLSHLLAVSGQNVALLALLAMPVLAALATLAIDPGVATDVGWQLSLAAVLGILLLAAPLRRAILRRTGSGGGLGGVLAEGVGLTVAATLATAPLIAFHFGELSTVTLLANLLAMPAVAPAMWMGMLSAAAGQVPGFPVEALNWVGALMLAYIARVAAWCARPDWAYLRT